MIETMRESTGFPDTYVFYCPNEDRTSVGKAHCFCLKAYNTLWHAMDDVAWYQETDGRMTQTIVTHDESESCRHPGDEEKVKVNLDKTAGIVKIYIDTA